uniref:Uncharacterized protein n=1 Tax=Pithovirus LCPAC102 TaxID=2506587 RepID=A0A4D5XG23_9VIRU|nr:MAG: hypothetical protein LCPAC102_01490 [Pithovirus LCPAC102]
MTSKGPSLATVIKQVDNAKAAKTFHRLGGGVLRINNATTYWQTHPNTIYLVSYHIAGEYQDLFNLLIGSGGFTDSNQVNNEISRLGVTSTNYRTDPYASLLRIAQDEERSIKGKGAKSSLAQRNDDQLALTLIDAFTAHRKSAKASGIKVVGGAISVDGTPTTGHRGQTAKALTLAQRLSEAKSGQVINVSSLLSPGVILSNGMVMKKDIKIVKAPTTKSRKLKMVPGINIASDNPAAYNRAIDILGANQQFKTQFGQLLSTQQVMSPAMQQAMQTIRTAPLGITPGSPTPTNIPTQPLTTFDQFRSAQLPSVPLGTLPAPQFVQQFGQQLPAVTAPIFSVPSQLGVQLGQTQFSPSQLTGGIPTPIVIGASSSPIRSASPVRIVPSPRSISPGGSRLVGSIPTTSVQPLPPLGSPRLSAF